LEPRLEELHFEMQMLAARYELDEEEQWEAEHGRYHRPVFCAAQYWSGRNGVQERLRHLVGWDRLPPNLNAAARGDQGEESVKGLQHVLDIASAAITDHRSRLAVATARERGNDLLYTAAAYDVAMNTLYRLLPPCHGCSCCNS
jgi:hypothetical protein